MKSEGFVQYSVRGEGGRGGGRGRGRGRGGGEATRILVLPPTDSPNPLEEAKLHRRTLGLIFGFTQRHPPPPPSMMVFWRGGGQGGD